MEQEKKTTEIFGKCYRLMHRVGAAMDDQFFADLWSRESDSFLSDFIVFLKKRGETLAEMAAKKISSEAPEPTIIELKPERILYSKDFVQHELARWQQHVAQCRRTLGIRLQKIAELLEIVKHVGKTDATTPLLLERELLKLRLAMMDTAREPRAGKKVKGDIRQNPALFKKELGLSGPAQKNISGIEIKLSPVHQEILSFIRSRNEQVQNSEIFARFGNIHRRTLKRKLSDLTSSGSLTRTSSGKRVYYSFGVKP